MIDNYYISSLVLFFLVLAFCRVYLNRYESLFVALIKFGVVFVYFGFVEHKWTHSDDIKYLEMSRILYESKGLIYLFTIDGFDYVFSHVLSYHYLYYLYNALMQSIFGYHYYAPVFGNVILSVLSGGLFYSLCREVGFERKLSKLFSICFILHVDVLTWSSLVNLKGGLVIFFSLAAFLSIIRFQERKNELYIVLFFLSLAPLMFIRFYVPILMLFTVLSYYTYKGVGIKFRYIVFIFLVFAFFSPVLSRLIKLEFIEPAGFLYGIIRFPLTPLFWNVEENYSYLVLSSIVNFILFPFMLIGLYQIWNKYTAIRVIIVYFVIMIGVYALIPELQGPRHRYQLIPIIVLGQVEGVLWTIRNITRLRKPLDN